MRFIALLVLAASLSSAANSLSNRRAPGFSLPDAKFVRYDLQDFRGKWLLIDFMLTNCPHCRKLAGMLEEVKKVHGAKIQILEVVLPPDTTATVADYKSELKITVPILFDQGQMAASYFEASPDKPSFDTPHLFIIDPQGTIVRDFGHDDAELADTPALLKELDACIKKATKP